MDDFNKLIEVSPDFKYYESCMESLPCQHGVKINDNSETWYGDTIYKYCVDNNLKVPEHFLQYKNYYLNKGRDGKHGMVYINDKCVGTSYNLKN
jgi:hypothetical protein